MPFFKRKTPKKTFEELSPEAEEKVGGVISKIRESRANDEQNLEYWLNRQGTTEFLAEINAILDPRSKCIDSWGAYQALSGVGGVVAARERLKRASYLKTLLEDGGGMSQIENSMIKAMALSTGVGESNVKDVLVRFAPNFTKELRSELLKDAFLGGSLEGPGYEKMLRLFESMKRLEQEIKVKKDVEDRFEKYGGVAQAEDQLRLVNKAYPSFWKKLLHPFAGPGRRGVARHELKDLGYVNVLPETRADRNLLKYVSSSRVENARNLSENLGFTDSQIDHRQVKLLAEWGGLKKVVDRLSFDLAKELTRSARRVLPRALVGKSPGEKEHFTEEMQSLAKGLSARTPRVRTGPPLVAIGGRGDMNLLPGVTGLQAQAYEANYSALQSRLTRDHQIKSKTEILAYSRKAKKRAVRKGGSGVSALKEKAELSTLMDLRDELVRVGRKQGVLNIEELADKMVKEALLDLKKELSDRSFIARLKTRSKNINNQNIKLIDQLVRSL